MSFRDLRIKTKLMFGFVLLAAIVLLVSGLGLRSLVDSNARFSSYLDGVAKRQNLATDIRGAATRRAIAARNLVLVTRPEDRELENRQVTQAHKDVQSLIPELRRMIESASDATPRDRELLADIERIEVSYKAVAEAVVSMANAGRREEAITKMNDECRPLLASLLKATADFIEYDKGLAAERVAEAERVYAAERNVMIAVCTAAVLGALALGWFLSQAITRPLSRAVTLAEAVAAGNLGTTIVADSRDETGQLLAALKTMNESLVGMVGSVRESADGIATAASEIAMGNLDLSSRTEQQASALQQTAASMQHMTSAVQQNTDSARQASQLATAAADAAARGGEVVDRVVSTMGQIRASSHKISEIIGVIDGIAFQTNILALNAAVESARAGEQGRGFAVVAGEVRTLAQRSAQAAKEIKALIGASVDTVEAGGALVDGAGTAMKDIVQQVSRMSDLMGEINAATQEQSTGIAEVNLAVASIDQGTQQNAALVEEGAAAAESLKQQSTQLMGLIARFQLAQPRSSFAA